MINEKNSKTNNDEDEKIEVPFSAVKNEKLGVTKEYNKQNRDALWDSAQDKASYKEKRFGEKQIVQDDITGDIVHKSQKAAENKYHAKNSSGERISSKYAKHSSEVDHIVPIKKIQAKGKHNPFVTDADIKRAANVEKNYQILAKSTNTSKGKQGNIEFAIKNDSLSAKQKAATIGKTVKASVAVNSELAKSTIKNAGSEFSQGAKNAIIQNSIVLTTEAVQHLMRYAQNEETGKEALEAFGKEAANLVLKGGGEQIAMDILLNELSNCNISALNQLAESNVIGSIIYAGVVIAKSSVRYINGDINGKEFFMEVGASGVSMAIGFAATAVFSSAFVAVAVSTVACYAVSSYFNTMKHLDDYKISEEQVVHLEIEALKEIKRQRKAFEQAVKEEYDFWNSEFEKGFNMILRTACEEVDSIQGITEGLDKILNVFGKSVRFKNTDEYITQLDQPLKLKF